MRTTGRVRADHDLPPRPPPLRQLLQGVLHNLDVISDRVRAGITGPQQGGQGFPGAQQAVVNEGAQGVEAEALPPRRAGVILFRMGIHQRSVEINDQGLVLAGTVQGRVLPACSHTCALDAARAWLIATNAFSGRTVARTLNRRLIVGSEATSP